MTRVNQCSISLRSQHALVSHTFTNCYDFIEIIVTSTTLLASTATLLLCPSYKNLPEDGVNVWLDTEQKYTSKWFTSCASQGIFTVTSVARNK
jgi:hypothetical protein